MQEDAESIRQWDLGGSLTIQLEIAIIFSV